MKNLKPILFIVGFFVFMLISHFGGVLKGNEFDEKLQKSYKMTTGRITGLGYRAGGAVGLPTFKFEVNGKDFEGNFSRSFLCKDDLSTSEKNFIMSLEIPVIYYPLDPTVRYILVREEQYEKFEVEMPEELKSILKKFFGC